MNSEIHVFAVRTSERVEARVGFSIPEIINILNFVIPFLMRCWSQTEDLSPEEVQAEVRRQNARNPRQLQRRTRHAIRRESNEPLTREQADELADALIEQILEEDHAVVMACTREVGI